MPIYEYQCQKCGKVQEALQSFSDKPLTKCRHCSGKLHKLVSRSSFHLKGTGWYVTDYANRSKDSSAAPGNKTEKTDAAKPEKTESPAKDTSTSSEKKPTRKKGADDTKKP